MSRIFQNSLKEVLKLSSFDLNFWLYVRTREDLVATDEIEISAKNPSIACGAYNSISLRIKASR